MQLVQPSHASRFYSTRVLLARTTRTAVDAACAIFAHASGLYSTRVLLARTTRTAVDAACALFARLESLLDPCTPGAHYLYRR